MNIRSRPFSGETVNNVSLKEIFIECENDLTTDNIDAVEKMELKSLDVFSKAKEYIRFYEG